MAHDHEHHEDLMQSLVNEYAELLEHSKQGIYLYFDDTHKACNSTLAKLLGYASPEEWAQVDAPFAEAFVDESSQETLVTAYRDAMEKGTASTIMVVWKKNGGGSVKTTVILVPIAYDGHLFALHFVSPK
jgi:hypothetical protein